MWGFYARKAWSRPSIRCARWSGERTQCWRGWAPIPSGRTRNWVGRASPRPRSGRYSWITGFWTYGYS